jgi:ATP-dependent helicase/nuclease subunit A
VTDDQAARDRIAGDLDTNMLVEAGAGSGKTTALVGRLLAYVQRGTPIEHLAAVTFTRKAATELRERFQEELEERVRAPGTAGIDSAVAARLAVALDDLDRIFIGTIHSFCARLLREHPLEAGLDPGFQEVKEEEWADLQREFWNRWLERCRRSGDPALEEFRRLGIDPRTLFDGFQVVVRYPDVEFPLVEQPAPDIAPCRTTLRNLLRVARGLMPAAEPAVGWDSLQRTVRRFEFLDRTGDWSDAATFCAAIARLGKTACTVVQNRWSGSREGKAAAKELETAFLEFVDRDVTGVLTSWREHRYPPVMRFLQRAAADFALERHAAGRLGFEDLLLGAAALLREHAGARRELGLRYRHLLVDEFQDTDPIQAEVCFLLTSDPSEGLDWRRVRPRPGGLFVVGDPKQSIYRFRRADIVVYEFVRARLAACCQVLQLARNFRSGKPIERLVNGYFANVFPAAASDGQAAFTPMVTENTPVSGEGIFRYQVRPAARNKASIVSEDAQRIASWIAARIETGRYAPSDFLILTDGKYGLDVYARALVERSVPVSTAGARLPQELELRELILVLEVLSDPANPVLVAAALEGLFFGCSPADLFEARQQGLEISAARRPSSAEGLAGRALVQLHEWWIFSQSHPVDALLERILDDTGLLPYAAGLPLGDNRSGTLLHLVTSVRGAAASGVSSLASAIDVIERTLTAESADASLRPGRTDAVRLMNLHKAKGLEARVICLLAPIDRPEHTPTECVDRLESGRAVGGLVLSHDDEPLAQPVGWAAMAVREARFQAAERERLLYVATTRAKRELIVAQLAWRKASGEATPDKSAWAPLGALLSVHAELLDLDVAPAPGRKRLEMAATQLAALVDAADRRRRRASTASYVTRTVTESAKSQRHQERTYDLPSIGEDRQGPGWGRAVHRTIEAMGRGRTGESLRAFIRTVVRDEELGASPEERQTMSDRIWQLTEQIVQTLEWARLREGQARFEFPVMQAQHEGDRLAITEGVIDAVTIGAGGWYLVDWKTDAVNNEVWHDRRHAYGAQVDAYARMLRQHDGKDADGSVVRLAAMSTDSERM